MEVKSGLDFETSTGFVDQKLGESYFCTRNTLSLRERDGTRVPCVSNEAILSIFGHVKGPTR